MREDREGTSGIKGYATDGVLGNIVLAQRPLNRGANASPYIIRRLLLALQVSLTYTLQG